VRNADQREPFHNRIIVEPGDPESVMKVSNGDRTPSDLGSEPHQSAVTTHPTQGAPSDSHDGDPSRVTARSRVAALASDPLYLEVAK